MQKQTRNEMIVGLIFFLGMGFLGAYTIVISGVFKGTQKTYQVTFPKIYGLKKGDTVRVEGLERGEVSELRLSEESGEQDRIRAKIKVSTDVEIFKTDFEVKVTPFSPLGGRIIEIKRGRANKDLVDPNKGSSDRFISIEDAAASNKEPDWIPGTAEGELLQTLNALVDENRTNVKKIVDNLAQVSEKLTSRDSVLGALINDEGTGFALKQMAADLSDATNSLRVIFKKVENGEGVAGQLFDEKSKLTTNVNDAAAAARSAIQHADVILANAEEGRSALGVIVSNDPVVSTNTKAVVRDLAAITSDVAGGNGSLSKFIHDPDFYDGAASTTKNLGKITGNVLESKSAAGVLLSDPETGRSIRSTLAHLESISASIDRADGALGLVVKDEKFRDRVGRIFTEVERLTVEFRDSVEDLREQAPVNAFLGAVFAAF